jgi:trehalose 6-phosphate phosphatase
MKAATPFELKPQEISLFLDVDGTLLDLAPRPDTVTIPDGLLDDLVLAAGSMGGALALVSGRPIAELDRLFAPLRLLASGVHGAEIRDFSEGTTTPVTQHRLPAAAWDSLLRLLGDFPGTFAENKGMSFSVHYRDVVTEASELIIALSDLIGRYAEWDLQLLTGHRVFEIKLPGFDKGTAITRFMAKAPFAGRIPVFVADDRIDWPGFAAALALGGLAFSVGADLPGLSGSFAQPEAVRAWLHELGR